MAHDDRHVDPHWNPFAAASRNDPDDGIGWDDGERPRPHRLPGKWVAILTAGALVASIAGIGLIITESRMSVNRHRLASQCEQTVLSMNQAREKLEERLSGDFKTIDTGLLDDEQRREYENLSDVAATPSVSCDADQRNTKLEDGIRRARKTKLAYENQTELVNALLTEYTALAQDNADEGAARRLATAIDTARDTIERTDGMSLSVPYLRTRLESVLEQARNVDARKNPSHADTLAATLEDLSEQVRSDAGCD